jgi:hypothetical protein
MAKKPRFAATAFNFGANAPRKPRRGKQGGGKGSAWAAYVGKKR